jgi:hypothetical protein
MYSPDSKSLLINSCVPVGAVGLGVSNSVLLGIEELALIVPFHGVDDVKEVPIEPDAEVPEIDECLVLVPFQPTNEVDGTPEADEVERVPLYELKSK